MMPASELCHFAFSASTLFVVCLQSIDRAYSNRLDRNTAKDSPIKKKNAIDATIDSIR